MDPAATEKRKRTIFADAAGLVKRLPQGFWIRFLGACVASLALDFVVEKSVDSRGGQSPLLAPVLAVDSVYHRIIMAPREPKVRFTALVEINLSIEPGVPSLHNICSQRQFLARLIRKLADVGPSAIGVDKYFLRAGCPESPEATDALVKAIEYGIAKTRIAVGLRIQCPPDSAAECTVDPPLDMVARNPAIQSVVNIDNDNRRLPLQWNAVLNGKAANFDTFSLRLSLLHEPNLRQRDPILEELLLKGDNPYIGFLNKEKFPLVYAGEIVCGQRVAEPLAWRQCPDVPVPAALAARLKNRIVIVGESNPDLDRHASLIGFDAEGYVLQANYVEAILDSRYYAAAHKFWNYLLAFVWMALFELLFIVYKGENVRLAFSLFVLLCLGYAVIDLTIMHLRVYLNPSIVSAIALLAKVSDLIFHPSKEIAEEIQK